MKITILLVVILLSFSCINRNTLDKDKNANSEILQNKNQIMTICSICGNKFEGNGYEEVSNGVWKELHEPNSGTICSVSCGRKHAQEFDDIANSFGVDLNESNSNNQNGGDYDMKNDGKVYETNACSICNGTGIEKNRSSFSDEVGRICPMCDGKGVRSY